MSLDLFINIDFWSFLDQFLNERGHYGQNGGIGSVFTIQEQMLTIPLQSPGKLSIFTVLSLFFYFFF